MPNYADTIGNFNWRISMKSLKLIFVLALVIVFIGATQAAIITSVDRTEGQSADKDPIGVYDGDTDPLPTEAGGLKDGNIVYSDRTYPWINTPAALVGSEYVRTFNNDKATNEIFINYAVTISEAAILAITVDDRIPDDWAEVDDQQTAVDLVVHTWAAPGTFVDSGLDLVIDESGGRVMSVYWTTVEMPAGTYNFGLQPAGKNFYSIIAIPEPATMMILGLGGLALLRRRR
jgi:hypothetical protein